MRDGGGEVENVGGGKMEKLLVIVIQLRRQGRPDLFQGE